MTSSDDCAIAIAGGGPVGLLTATLCAEAGLEVTLIEAEMQPPRDLRATSFHPPTLDMLAAIGLAAPLIAQGMRCPSWQVRMHPSGERAVFELASIAADTAHPFRLQCEQWKLAWLLLERLARHPCARLMLGARLTGFTQDDDGVTIIAGEKSFRARMLIGADGWRSTVREQLGLAFEGETYPETTLVVTTPFRFEDAIEGMSMVTSTWTPDSHVAFLRLPEFWRLALYPREDRPLEDQITPDAVEAALQGLHARPAPYPVDAIWPYRVHQRMVRHYRVGRVALAGDAAHVNSPAGGMGLNAGIHDAFALAEALDAIIRDGATLDLLDRYERRRRPIAEADILGLAARNRARMREHDPDKRRAALAELQAIARDPARHREFVLRASMIEGLRRAEAIA